MSDLHAIGGSPHGLQPPPEQKSKAPEKLDRHTSELLDTYEKRRYANGQAIRPHLWANQYNVQTSQLEVCLGIKHNRFGQAGDVANDSYYESTRLKQNSVIKLS